MFATAAAIFSILLLLTGAAKVARPRDVQIAMTRLGLPRVPGSGVVIGVTEILVGVASLLVADALWIQSALYAVFAVWVGVALAAKVPLASCGCLGRSDTPPSLSHVVLNVLAAVVSVGATFGEPLTLASGIGLVAQLGVLVGGVFASYMVLSDGARLAGVRRA